MADFRATIVIPVYNQYNALKKVLMSFMKQTIATDSYEIVIVDDGSEDNLKYETSITLTTMYNMDIVLYHQQNQGRATARNVGINLAKHEVIIFCDADRIPCESFVEQHLKMHQSAKNIVIGVQYDIFCKKLDFLFDNEIDWKNINRFSKVPNYFGRIQKIYEGNKSLAPNLCWLSFMVGNASVSKKFLEEVGCFDEDFKDWGFEHLELGLRLQKKKGRFYVSQSAASYHIPHHRETNFYWEKIEKSALILSSKHPEIDISIMQTLLMKNIDVLECNEIIFKDEKL